MDGAWPNYIFILRFVFLLLLSSGLERKCFFVCNSFTCRNVDREGMVDVCVQLTMCDGRNKKCQGNERRARPPLCPSIEKNTHFQKNRQFQRFEQSKKRKKEKHFRKNTSIISQWDVHKHDNFQMENETKPKRNFPEFVNVKNFFASYNINKI